MATLREKSQKKNYGFAVLIFIIVGVSLVLLSLADFINAYASTRWPAVPGWITQSGIRIYKDKGTAYCPEISWSYRVQGINYTGSNDPFCASLSQAQAKVAKFPTGARVSISYSPQNPDESTIEPGMRKFPIFFLFIGGVAIVVAFILI